MRFYRIFHLQSARQPGAIKMECQHRAGPLQGKPVTITKIKQALGDYFSFEFAR